MVFICKGVANWEWLVCNEGENFWIGVNICMLLVTELKRDQYSVGECTCMGSIPHAALFIDNCRPPALLMGPNKSSVCTTSLALTKGNMGRFPLRLCAPGSLKGA